MVKSTRPTLHQHPSTGIGYPSKLRLGLTRTYYSMAQVLGLKRLQDYIKVRQQWQRSACAASPHPAKNPQRNLVLVPAQGSLSLDPSQPVSLLGVTYGGLPAEAAAAADTEQVRQAWGGRAGISAVAVHTGFCAGSLLSKIQACKAADGLLLLH